MKSNKRLYRTVKQVFDPTNYPEDRSVPLHAGDVVVWIPPDLDAKVAIALERVGNQVKIKTLDGVERVVDPRTLVSPKRKEGSRTNVNG